MSITYSVSLENYSDLDDILWGGARDKWNSASDEVKSTIWFILEDFSQFDSLTQINDFIWFNCDEFFYPEELL